MTSSSVREDFSDLFWNFFSVKSPLLRHINMSRINSPTVSMPPAEKKVAWYDLVLSATKPEKRRHERLGYKQAKWHIISGFFCMRRLGVLSFSPLPLPGCSFSFVWFQGYLRFWFLLPKSSCPSWKKRFSKVIKLLISKPKWEGKLLILRVLNFSHFSAQWFRGARQHSRKSNTIFGELNKLIQGCIITKILVSKYTNEQQQLYKLFLQLESTGKRCYGTFKLCQPSLASKVLTITSKF